MNDFNALTHILNDAGRHPLLTPEEEIHLARRVQAMMAIKAEKPDGPFSLQEKRLLRRGMQARDRMVTANLRLVANVCRKFMRNMPALGVSPEDMMQDGIVGLVRGVEGFDPERGYKLSTYIYWWIRQGINRGLHSNARTIRLPTHVAEKVFKINHVQNQLRLELGRDPTGEEIAAGLQVTVEEYRRFLQMGVRPTSLDSTGQDEGLAIVDLLPDGTTLETQLDDLSERLDLERMAGLIDSYLNEKERQVVKMHFGIGMEAMSWREIGKAMQMHHEGARQHLKRGLRKLRREMVLRPQVEQEVMKAWELAA